MELLARILGVLFLIFWLFYIPASRRTIRMNGSILHATIFQYNILPFIIGIALVISGKLTVLIAVPVLWFLAIPFSGFFLFFFPLIMGWIFGTMICSEVIPNSRGWYYGGGGIGVLVMFVVCTVVVAIITTPCQEKGNKYCLTKG